MLGPQAPGLGAVGPDLFDPKRPAGQQRQRRSAGPKDLPPALAPRPVQLDAFELHRAVSTCCPRDQLICCPAHGARRTCLTDENLTTEDMTWAGEAKFTAWDWSSRRLSCSHATPVVESDVVAGLVVGAGAGNKLMAQVDSSVDSGVCIISEAGYSTS